MKLKAKRKWLIPRICVIIAAACIVVAAVFFVLSATAGNALYDQQVAKYWESSSGEENTMRYSQVTVFLGRGTGFGYDGMARMRQTLAARYASESIAPTKTDARVWLDAGYAMTTVTIESGKNSVTADAVGIIGDYFRFHEIELMGGQYLNPAEPSRDIVLLDWDAAWRLFGASNVAGFELMVGGIRCVVGGVVENADDDAATMMIYTSFELLERLNPRVEMSVVEFVVPSPVTGYGLQTVTDMFSDIATADRIIVENSTRFLLSERLKGIGKLGESVRQTQSIALPDWENRARITEFRATVFLLLAIVFAVFPAGVVLVLIGKLYRRRGVVIVVAKKLPAAVRTGVQRRKNSPRRRAKTEPEHEIEYNAQTEDIGPDIDGQGVVNKQGKAGDGPLTPVNERETDEI